MARYIVQDANEVAECLQTLDLFLRAGVHYLTNAEWGCRDGVHTAWIIIEAGDDSEVRRMLPPVIRDRAEVVRLNRFSPEEIRDLHRQAKTEGGAEAGE